MGVSKMLMGNASVRCSTLQAAQCMQLVSNVQYQSKMNAEAVNKLKEDLLTCDICESEAFYGGADFHSLPCPCQHPICESCLQNIVKKQKAHALPLCPWCRQPFEFQETGKLPTLRFAAHLAEKLKSIPKKGKTAVKNLPSRGRPIKEKKEHEKRLFIRKLTNIPSNLVVACAGLGGVFYGHLSRTYGIVQINAMTGNMLFFGDAHSCYDDMTHNGKELYTVNITQQSVEVYRDTKCLRKWSCAKKPPIYTRIALCPGGRLAVWAQIPQERIIHFTSYGTTLLVANHGRSDKHLIELLGDAAVMTIFKNSVWLLNRRDNHLWEIPMEQSIDAISYKKPIQRLKIGCFSNAFHWGQDLILFKMGELIKMIDLKEIKAMSENGQQGMSIKPTINNIIGSVCKKSDGVVISSDGSMLVKDQDGSLSLYSLLSSTGKTEAVEIAREAVEGPEYKSIHEVIESKMRSFEQTCYLKLGTAVFNLILLTVFFIFLWRFNWLTNHLRFIEKELRTVCQYGNEYFPALMRSYGWSNLYISVCEFEMV
ncbi:uncharacterized protein [Watersipora subatra]|uniref:uncharacterized protein n=1 Tax=Watersipora subatra TaxID=2589382 RepID=UPI00355B39D9